MFIVGKKQFIKQFWGVTLLLLALFSYQRSLSQENVGVRNITLEWEPMEQATGYQIEIKAIASQDEGKEIQPILQTVSTTTWQGPLSPGKYSMRLRSKDHRGVPGKWGDAIDFEVKLLQVNYLTPKTNQVIKTKVDETYKVDFSWQPVPGANGYTIQIIDSSGKVIVEEKVKDAKYSSELPVASKYTWRVVARNEKGIESEREEKMASFVLIGKQLDSPKIHEPNNEFVRELSWDPVNKHQTYDVSLKRKVGKSEWKEEKRYDAYQLEKIPVDENLSGGRYSLQVIARAPLRESSEAVQLGFPVFKGDRSPASEEKATLRQSIEKRHQIYAIASYLLTLADYQGRNMEMGGSQVEYKSQISGTGRLGIGYDFKNSPWGLQGILDAGGILIDNKNTVFGSGEANAIRKYRFESGTQFRLGMGVFYKEFPEIRASNNGSTLIIREVRNVGSWGPQLFGEWWQPISPKLGFQMNYHIYARTLGGNPIVPTSSYQLGFLGSYKLQPTITGLMGYAFRSEQIKYKAQAGDATSSSLASAGDVNEAKMEGHYLNLLMEIEF